MKTHKWISNSPDVLAQIPQSICVSEIDFDKDAMPAVKTLGMKCLPSQDCFVYSVNETKDFVVTKRSYLKKSLLYLIRWD